MAGSAQDIRDWMSGLFAAGYTFIPATLVAGQNYTISSKTEYIVCDWADAAGDINIATPVTPTDGMFFTVRLGPDAGGLSDVIITPTGYTIEDPGSPGTFGSTLTLDTPNVNYSWAWNPNANRYDLVFGIPTVSNPTTVLDLDFSAQSTQNLTSNGNYTVAGLTWKKENSANDNGSVTPRIANGSGLELGCNGSGNYNGTGARTAPIFFLTLSQIVPTAMRRRKLRVYVELSGNEQNSGDFGFVAIDTDDNGPTVGTVVKRGNVSSAGIKLEQYLNGGAQYAVAKAFALSSANTVLVLDVDLGAFFFGEVQTGAGGGAWPSYANTTPQLPTDSTVGIALGAVSLSGSTPNYKAVFKRLRVDVMPE